MLSRKQKGKIAHCLHSCIDYNQFVFNLLGSDSVTVNRLPANPLDNCE